MITKKDVIDRVKIIFESDYPNINDKFKDDMNCFIGFVVEKTMEVLDKKLD